MFSNKTTCRWMAALLVFAISAPLQAQSTRSGKRATSAHRKLKRPTGGSSDVQKQIELITRLQSLMQNRAQEPAGESEGLSSSQKSLMDSVLQQFQGSNTLPDLSSLPPELVGKVMSDPKARQDVKEMLEKFQQDRIVPKGNGTGGFRPPPTDPTSNRPADGVGGPSTSRRPDRNQPRQPNRPSADELNSVPRSPSAELQPPEFNSERSDQRRLRQPDSGDRESSGQNSATPDDSGSPPIRMPSEPESEYLDRYSDFVERQIERQRRGGVTSPLDSSELPSQPSSPIVPGREPPSNRDPGRRSDDTEASNRNDNRNVNRSTTPQSLPPTISDFLEDLADLPLPPSETPSSGSSSRPGRSTNRQRNTGSQSEAGRPSSQQPRQSETEKNQGASSGDAEQLSQRQQEMKQELDRSGLKSTLRKIVREARQQMKNKPAVEQGVGRSANGGNADSGGGLLDDLSPNMEKAIIRSLDSIGKDVLQMAKDGKLTSPDSSKTDTANTKPSMPSQTPSAQPPPSDANESSWGKKASDFFSDVVGPPIDSEQSPGSAAGQAGDSSSSSSLPSVEFSWVPFLLLGVIMLFVFGFAVKSGVIGGDSQSAGMPVSAQFASGMRSREDVVKAFHRLALKPENDAETWWTHQQVEEQLKSRTATRNQPIKILADVYEQARYLPEEAALNEQQLEEARDALKRCES